MAKKSKMPDVREELGKVLVGYKKIVEEFGETPIPKYGNNEGLYKSGVNALLSLVYNVNLGKNFNKAIKENKDVVKKEENAINDYFERVYSPTVDCCLSYPDVLSDEEEREKFIESLRIINNPKIRM